MKLDYDVNDRDYPHALYFFENNELLNSLDDKYPNISFYSIGPVLRGDAHEIVMESGSHTTSVNMSVSDFNTKVSETNPDNVIVELIVAAVDSVIERCPIRDVLNKVLCTSIYFQYATRIREDIRDKEDTMYVVFRGILVSAY